MGEFISLVNIEQGDEQNAQAPYSLDLKAEFCQGSCTAVVVDRFYIALLSALEQTHCVFVACESK